MGPGHSPAPSRSSRILWQCADRHKPVGGGNADVRGVWWLHALGSGVSDYLRAVLPARSRVHVLDDHDLHARGVRPRRVRTAAPTLEAAFFYISPTAPSVWGRVSPAYTAKKGARWHPGTHVPSGAPWRRGCQGRPLPVGRDSCYDGREPTKSPSPRGIGRAR